MCTACGFVFYIDPKLAVIALVPYQGGLVMVRRSIEPGYGLWVVPGGFVDVGEKVEAAVVRETREEASLNVRVVRLLNVHSYVNSRTVVLSYITEYISGELAAGDEELEAQVFLPTRSPGTTSPSAPPGTRCRSIAAEAARLRLGPGAAPPS